MVDLETRLPSPALRRFVRLYAGRRLAPGAHLNEPVLARLGGLFEFHFAGLYRVPIVGTGRCEPCAPMLVIGPISYQRVQLQADSNVDALTVMFQPHGLYGLLGIPTHLLAEHAEEAHALLGRKITHLYRSLCAATTFSGRTALLDTFLLTQLAQRKPASGLDWSRAFDHFASSPETLSVRQLAADLDTTVRQVERKALDYSGMNPQTMRRVARFTRALRLRSNAIASGALTWTQIAHAAGYYDQMHMIREFRTLGGAVPTALTSQLESHHGTSLLLRHE